MKNQIVIFTKKKNLSVINDDYLSTDIYGLFFLSVIIDIKLPMNFWSSVIIDKFSDLLLKFIDKYFIDKFLIIWNINFSCSKVPWYLYKKCFSRWTYYNIHHTILVRTFFWQKITYKRNFNSMIKIYYDDYHYYFFIYRNIKIYNIR